MLKTISGVTFLLIAAVVSGCATPLFSESQTSITTRVEPAQDKAHTLLRCIQSSTGNCYFFLGDAQVHAPQMIKVASGESLEIPTPDTPTPYCVASSERHDAENCAHQVINPNSSTSRTESAGIKMP